MAVFLSNQRFSIDAWFRLPLAGKKQLLQEVFEKSLNFWQSSLFAPAIFSSVVDLDCVFFWSWIRIVIFKCWIRI